MIIVDIAANICNRSLPVITGQFHTPFYKEYKNYNLNSFDTLFNICTTVHIFESRFYKVIRPTYFLLYII